jgi:hypothetical protein
MFNHHREPKIKIRVIIIAVLIVLILAAVTLNFTIKDTKTSQTTSPASSPSPSTSTSQVNTQAPPASSPPSAPTTPAPQPAPTPAPVQPAPQSKPAPVTPPAPPAPVYPTISTSELQSIMQNFPQVMSIKDPKIKMQFHDNNSLYLGYTYFIGSGGQVSQFSGQAYDMWLTINVFDVLALKSSSNKCADLKAVIKSGKAWVIEQSSNPLVIMKYLSIKSCVM